MSQALKNCRHIPGWQKDFLAAVRDGYTDKVAANMAGVSTFVVRKRYESDSTFKQQYDDTFSNRRERPGHGAW